MSASAASSGRRDAAAAEGLKSRGGRRLGGCFGTDEDVEAGLPSEQSKYTKVGYSKQLSLMLVCRNIFASRSKLELCCS